MYQQQQHQQEMDLINDLLSGIPSFEQEYPEGTAESDGLEVTQQPQPPQISIADLSSFNGGRMPMNTLSSSSFQNLMNGGRFIPTDVQTLPQQQAVQLKKNFKHYGGRTKIKPVRKSYPAPLKKK